jgi:hypothetical protein
VLHAELLIVKQQKWNLFWTGHESSIVWDHQRSGSWLAIYQTFHVKIKQTDETQKSMLTLFFNPHRFAAIDLLPDGITFNAAYFVA